MCYSILSCFLFFSENCSLYKDRYRIASIRYQLYSNRIHDMATYTYILQVKVWIFQCLHCTYLIILQIDVQPVEQKYKVGAPQKEEKMLIKEKGGNLVKTYQPTVAQQPPFATQVLHKYMPIVKVIVQTYGLNRI